MPVRALTSLTTTTGAFAQLSATSVGEKRITLTIIASTLFNSTSNNLVETTLTAGTYVVMDDPANLYFKAITTGSFVHAFIQN